MYYGTRKDCPESQWQWCLDVEAMRKKMVKGNSPLPAVRPLHSAHHFPFHSLPAIVSRWWAKAFRVVKLLASSDADDAVKVPLEWV